MDSAPCAMDLVPTISDGDDDDRPDFDGFAAAFAETKKFHEAPGIKTKCLGV